VEDRRNVLVIRLPGEVSKETAVSVMVALERGIETAFQLEDSELESERLPDPEDRGRALFIESAEGGAGVLRRLAEEEDALAQAAKAALELMHFNPETGDDMAAELDQRDPCVAACYQCLLSYGNQSAHQMIDRRLARDIMLELASAKVYRDSAGEEAGEEREEADQPATVLEPASPAAAFVSWLREHGYRVPDESGSDIAEAKARPDFVYRNGRTGVAVFLGGTLRDQDAEDDLRDEGWSVVRQRAGESREDFVRRFPSVFGEWHGGRR
jgi:hypothetical protein